MVRCGAGLIDFGKGQLPKHAHVRFLMRLVFLPAMENTSDQTADRTSFARLGNSEITFTETVAVIPVGRKFVDVDKEPAPQSKKHGHNGYPLDQPGRVGANGAVADDEKNCEGQERTAEGKEKRQPFFLARSRFCLRRE